MKKLIIFLIPIIGFSQNCENPILDQVLEDSLVNPYFQLALSLNINELQYLNNCKENQSYTMFAPSINVPTESATMLVGLGGSLIDYISYYIHSENLSSSDLIDLNGTTIQMMDGENAEINYYDGPFINQAMITSSDICTCNGVIHIIDDLIWSPNINLGESQRDIIFNYNINTKSININNSNQINGLVQVVDINGRILYSKHINDTHSIKLHKYKSGIYFVNFSHEKEITSKKIVIH